MCLSWWGTTPSRPAWTPARRSSSRRVSAETRRPWWVSRKSAIFPVRGWRSGRPGDRCVTIRSSRARVSSSIGTIRSVSSLPSGIFSQAPEPGPRARSPARDRQARRCAAVRRDGQRREAALHQAQPGPLAHRREGELHQVSVASSPGPPPTGTGRTGGRPGRTGPGRRPEAGSLPRWRPGPPPTPPPRRGRRPRCRGAARRSAGPGTLGHTGRVKCRSYSKLRVGPDSPSGARIWAHPPRTGSPGTAGSSAVTGHPSRCA